MTYLGESFRVNSFPCRLSGHLELLKKKGARLAVSVHGL